MFENYIVNPIFPGDTIEVSIRERKEELYTIFNKLSRSHEINFKSILGLDSNEYPLLCLKVFSINYVKNDNKISCRLFIKENSNRLSYIGMGYLSIFLNFKYSREYELQSTSLQIYFNSHYCEYEIKGSFLVKTVKLINRDTLNFIRKDICCDTCPLIHNVCEGERSTEPCYYSNNIMKGVLLGDLVEIESNFGNKSYKYQGIVSAINIYGSIGIIFEDDKKDKNSSWNVMKYKLYDDINSGTIKHIHYCSAYREITDIVVKKKVGISSFNLSCNYCIFDECIENCKSKDINNFLKNWRLC